MFVGRAAKKAAHVFQKAYREKTSTTITLPAILWMQISRMVLVCDVKISQLGRKNLAVRFNLISDPPRLAANADGVEPNNPFDEIYRPPSR